MNDIPPKIVLLQIFSIITTASASFFILDFYTNIQYKFIPCLTVLISSSISLLIRYITFKNTKK